MTFSKKWSNLLVVLQVTGNDHHLEPHSFHQLKLRLQLQLHLQLQLRFQLPFRLQPLESFALVSLAERTPGQMTPELNAHTDIE